jgi:hypothetical protein
MYIKKQASVDYTGNMKSAQVFKEEDGEFVTHLP